MILTLVFGLASREKAHLNLDTKAGKIAIEWLILPICWVYPCIVRPCDSESLEDGCFSASF